MEPVHIDVQQDKGQPSSQETQKKRKYTKKKHETKPLKPAQELSTHNPQETGTEINPDLVHYTHKLEFELGVAKKKLKKQRKQFKHMINSLVTFFDNKGISPKMIDEYVHAIGLELNDSDNESNFEKLFTTHKYQVIEETKKPIEIDTGHILVPKSSSKKASEDLQRGASADNDDVIVMHSTKPKKKKEKNPEAQEEPKKRKKREKAKNASDDINTNSNSTAIPGPEDGHEAPSGKEAISKPEDKSKKTDVIHIDEEPAQAKPVAHLYPDNPLNFAAANPLNMFHQAIGNEALAYNKIFQELLKLNNSGSQQNFMNYYSPANFK